MDKRREEYYNLLLKRCIKVKDKLFLFGHKINEDYINEIVECAKKLGVSDIYVELEDDFQEKELLNSINVEDIKNRKEFSCDKWNEYARKDSAFLIMKSELPGVMDDVDSNKIIEMNRVKRHNQNEYKTKQLSYVIPWCIGLLPNKYWANSLLGEREDNVEKLFDIIMTLCHVENGKAVDTWNSIIENNTKIVNKLNDLNIKELHYTSDKGTDFTVGLYKGAIWKGTAKGEYIVNMPSYEVFTTPDKNRLNGVVYSTRSLRYCGVLINDFRLEFKNGKIVDVKAKVGEDALKSLIRCTNGADTLGECALVDCSSPIYKSNMIFGNTLLDENAACHFALGNAFPICIKDYNTFTKEQLSNEIGFNTADVHVDFMVGDESVNIVATTYSGQNVQIMKNGRIL